MFHELVFRCNEVQDSYYVPTLYQYQFEIEDGYRRDGSPVRIGYDDTRCQSYKTFYHGNLPLFRGNIAILC
jgi:hypothetical protein